MEAKDLNYLHLEELLGSLLTHEMGLNEDEEQAPKGDRRTCFPLKSKVVEDPRMKQIRTMMKRWPCTLKDFDAS